MNIDEQLLGLNEAEKAGEFRASKRIQASEESAQESSSFREKVRAAKGLNVVNEEKVKGSNSGDNPFRKMTDGLLRAAWTNLIPSFGITLLYINAHAFLSKSSGSKYFRELGEEWIPAGARKLEGAGMKKAASMAKTIEPAGCACLNLGCLFLVLLIIAIISIAASIVTLDLAFIWELFKGSISELKSIF